MQDHAVNSDLYPNFHFPVFLFAKKITYNQSIYITGPLSRNMVEIVNIGQNERSRWIN